MKLAITGDTHSDIDFTKLEMPFLSYASNYLTYADIDVMIICGDAGFIWDNGKEDKTIQDKISKLPYTLLCVLGNHENYDIINNIKIEEWNGIKVRRVTDNCFYLVSPQIFTLNGKSFFVMNGATSIDKSFRTPHISWWEQELPTEEEIEEARQLLENNNNQVDYIITHCAPTKVLYAMFKNVFIEDIDRLNTFFDYVDNVVTYKAWYFGHYHETDDYSDRNGNKYCLYNYIKLLLD